MDGRVIFSPKADHNIWWTDGWRVLIDMMHHRRRLSLIVADFDPSYHNAIIFLKYLPTHTLPNVGLGDL